MRTAASYLIGMVSLLCSCSNEELLEQYEAPVPIRFSTQCIEIETKLSGAIPSNVLPEHTEISIFSIEHPTGQPADCWNPGIFNNTLGTTDAAGDILYQNTYYFPIGNQLDFFAVYPSLQEMGTAYADQEEIELSLHEEAAAQYDLMYASLPQQSKKSEKLVFEFKHLLSQVQISISKNASATVSLPLTKIEIVAPGRGILNLWKGTLTPLAGSDTHFTLTTQADITDTPLSVGYFLLFPQIPADFILTFGNDNAEVYYVTTAGEPTQWEAGVNYQYHIVINRDIPAQNPAPTENADSTSTETPTENKTDSPASDENAGSTANDPAENEEQHPTPDATTKTSAAGKSTFLYLN